MGGEFRGEWIHMYVLVSLFAVRLKLSQHRPSAIPRYKIKFFFLKLLLLNMSFYWHFYSWQSEVGTAQIFLSEYSTVFPQDGIFYPQDSWEGVPCDDTIWVLKSKSQSLNSGLGSRICPHPIAEKLAHSLASQSPREWGLYKNKEA